MGKRGDNLDRFIIRVKEVLESFRIISQVLATLAIFSENNSSKVQATAYNTSLGTNSSNLGVSKLQASVKASTEFG
jgi:NADH:ubiquinone oxidoreductase subunit D